MSFDLSIIVPLYNGESYITRCLDSLLRNKPSNVEIVVVDDGSIDGGPEQIRSRYSECLIRNDLVLLVQENKGVSSARNSGIAQSQGRYVGFVDADDYILDGYYIEILNAINNESPDIIEFGWKVLLDGKLGESSYVHEEFGSYQIQSNLNSIFSASIWYPWIRVVKKDTLKLPLFPVGVSFCEDMMAFCHIYDASTKGYQINKAIYAYMINPEGATLNIKPSYYSNMLAFYAEILEKKGKHFDLLKISIFYVLFRCSTQLGIPLVVPSEIDLDFKRIRRSWYLYREVGFRKIRVFVFPSISKLIINIKNIWRD